MKKIVIAGGTGLIGSKLAEMLQKRGYAVTILTRSNKNGSPSGIAFSQWSPNEGIIDKQVIASADVVVNVSGENVADKRWSDKRKKEILQSRIESTELLLNTIKDANARVQSYISASAIGWYGPDTKETRQKGFNESAPHHDDYLGNTCKLWEDAAHKAEGLGIRTVILRTGIVLAKEGGALKEFIKPVRRGIAAIIGSGNQMISWIHIEDLCRMYSSAIENESINGVYNAAAPQPVTNEQLTLELAKQKRKTAFIPIHVPSFFIKILLGEMSIEVLKSTTVSADKIKNAGFQFLFPGIQSAVADLIKD